MLKSANAQEFKIRGRLHVDAFYGLQDADSFSNGFNNTSGENPSFFGYSVQSSYVLTGDSRSYKNGHVGTVSPQSEKGAWGVAIRYSVMNLDYKKAQFIGGNQSNITIGLNRYITSKLRFMANVVFVTLENSSDSAILGVARAQYS